MVRRLIIATVIAVGVGWLLTPPSLPKKQLELVPLEITNTIFEPAVEFKDRIELPNDMFCPEWAQLAIETGWQEEDLAKLDSVIHRESRCYTTVHYDQDPYGGSYGLTQINAFWCKPTDLYPTGYLQAFGILETCEELYSPRTNLLAARLIWIYSQSRYDDGWLPWQK